MQRRTKGGTIEPHPTENAIILNYKIEATVYGEPGDKMVEESKVIRREIRSGNIFFERRRARVCVLLRHEIVPKLALEQMGTRKTIEIHANGPKCACCASLYSVANAEARFSSVCASSANCIGWSVCCYRFVRRRNETR